MNADEERPIWQPAPSRSATDPAEFDSPLSKEVLGEHQCPLCMIGPIRRRGRVPAEVLADVRVRRPNQQMLVARQVPVTATSQDSGLIPERPFAGAGLEYRMTAP